ncbi:MAG TPA: CerR family C-terminal domain-containing protein [Vicinamibacterales bacterium]|nr:CerR family C-terminal domain-containing protein [Vicinamibacterales bacterium]
MRAAPKSPATDQRTRARLLEAATRLFAQDGFRRVTVRAICRAAHANVAAVNYHFRNKLGLYREVTEAGIAVLQETTALAIEAGDRGTPEEKLRAYVAVVTSRLLSTTGHDWLQHLISHEMVDPTPALSTLIDRGLRPRLDYLGRIVGEMLQLPADHPRVVECVTSIHAQILLFRPNPISDRLRARAKAGAASPAEIANHITAFSLAGIRAIESQAGPPRTIADGSR